MGFPPLTAPSLPILAGQVCTRALKDSTALVGVLQLPFTPIEGAAYLMLEGNESLQIVPEALDSGVPAECGSYGVNALLRQAIWPKTTRVDARVVRFVEAFPDTQHWVVFGPGAHAPAPEAPTHRWQAIDGAGRLLDIPAPMEARGLAVGQILTTEAIWPDAHGTLHAMSEHLSEWRGHYHRYHLLLAQSTRDPEVNRTLETTLLQDPHFREISLGRIDREYCAFLAGMEDRQALLPDRPRSAAELARQNDISDAVIRPLLTDRAAVRLNEMADLAQSLSPPRRRPGRSP
jgi:hypothetical protein